MSLLSNNCNFLLWCWLSTNPVNLKSRKKAWSWLFKPLYFQTRIKKLKDLILFLLLQRFCCFKSFWLLSSECPCAPLMGLIWYSAPMPSLIFVCETKCFDGGWLLKRLCVYQGLFLCVCAEWEFYGLSQYSTLCAFCSKQEHSRLNFGFASSSLPPPSSFVVSKQHVCVCQMWLLAVCT